MDGSSGTIQHKPLQRIRIQYNIEETIKGEYSNIIEGRFKFNGVFTGLIMNEKNKTLKWTNKMEIAYTKYGDKGPILLFLHGVPTNKRQKWHIQYKTGPFCRTIAIDMLGMGKSSQPRFYGKKKIIDKLITLKKIKYLNKKNKPYEIESTESIEQFESRIENEGGIFGIQGSIPKIELEEYTEWHWKWDTVYIDVLMRALFDDEQFIFESDDWGGGIGLSYANEFCANVDKSKNRAYSIILTDPIAFDGYPVKEIEAFGRASAVDDNTFMLLLAKADQEMWQIYKTMVHNPDEVYDQYTLRDIIFPYANVNYEQNGGLNPLEMQLNFHNLHVLCDRSSILSPKLLLPFNPDNGYGIKFQNITCPVMVEWGEYDNMMPAAQTERYANAFRSAPTQIHYIPRAGHFAATDQPDYVAETILNYIRQLHNWNHLPMDLAQAFQGYFIQRWKGDEQYLLNYLNDRFYSVQF